MAKGMHIREILERADQGDLLEDADNLLTELVEAVGSNGGKGEVTIKVTVKEIKGKDAVEVTASATLKKPAPTRMGSPYFVTEDNRLSRKHGSQPDLPGTEPRGRRGLSDDETVDDDGVIHKLDTSKKRPN